MNLAGGVGDIAFCDRFATLLDFSFGFFLNIATPRHDGTAILNIGFRVKLNIALFIFNFALVVNPVLGIELHLSLSVERAAVYNPPLTVNGERIGTCTDMPSVTHAHALFRTNQVDLPAYIPPSSPTSIATVGFSSLQAVDLYE